MVPRVDTLDRLLRQCRGELQVAPRPGAGVDRTQLRERLKLSPTQRVEAAAVGPGDRPVARECCAIGRRLTTR